MTDAADVQAAVDRLASAVGQSVLVEDRDQHPVWWSTTGVVDSTRTMTILDRRVAPKAAAVLTQFGLALATAPVRTPAMPEAGMWARWCMPVRQERRLLGYLWVLDPDETVGAADLVRLVEVAELAAEVLSRNAQAGEHHLQLRDELLARLMRGRDEDAARELARLEHLPHDARVQVEAPAKPGGWLLPNGLSAHVARGRARAATSGAPLPLVSLAEAAYRAASTCRALVAGARPEPPSWDGLGAWRLIVEAPADLTVAQVHPGADVLAAQARPDLMVTARSVLDHGGDIVAAARELHIHRTTLYYRLDRITELIGVDLRSSRVRTDLQLALWLAAYRVVPSTNVEPG
jgi:hypothetical protein